MNVSQVLQASILKLSPSSESARLDAEVLITHALGWQRTHLLTRDSQILSDTQLDAINKLIKRRLNGEPVAYIVGEQEFWSLPLMVNASTLIPRPETEHLVETALQYLSLDGTKAVLDLGTGSGAIVLALASEQPRHHYTAVDISHEALQIARQNADKLKIPGIRFVRSHWFSKLGDAKYDLIVSNPPYIESADEHLQQGDVAAEPLSALASGEDGLEDIRHLVSRSTTHLNPGGWLMMEHGWNQAAKVRKLLVAHKYKNIQSIQDYSNIERLTIAQIP